MSFDDDLKAQVAAAKARKDAAASQAADEARDKIQTKESKEQAFTALKDRVSRFVDKDIVPLMTQAQRAVEGRVFTGNFINNRPGEFDGVVGHELIGGGKIQALVAFGKGNDCVLYALATANQEARYSENTSLPLDALENGSAKKWFEAHIPAALGQFLNKG